VSLVLLLSLACTHNKTQVADSGGTTSTISTVVGDCDPTVGIPVGNLGDPTEFFAADAHADVFGTEAPDPWAVHLGFPSRDASTSVSMLWRTDVDTMSSLVEFGPAKGFPKGASQVAGYTFLYGSGEIGTGAYRMHEVRLCGMLSPGTTYSYRVGGEGHWSDSTTFSTPEPAGSVDTFRVAFAGDSRDDMTTWGAILAAIDAHSPDLIVFSGDMVMFGSNQEEWDDWFAATGTVLARTPFLSSHGNHEFLAQNYFAQFGFPGNEEWFAYDYDDMLLLSLNDTVRDPDQIATEQRTFIQDELGATTLPWRIATHHKSAYSVCTTHGSDKTVRAAWSDAFEDGGVQVVAAGHNHIYERSVPIHNEKKVAPGQGTVYLVTGGAGAPLYNRVKDEWFNAVNNPVNHYIIADFGPTQVDMVVRDINDNIIDQFTVPR